MNFSSGSFDFRNLSIVCVQPLQKLCNHSRVLMRNFHIINMPLSGELFTIYNFICDTWIVWDQFETDRFNIVYQFVVEKQNYLDLFSPPTTTATTLDSSSSS